jgi:CHAT domain
MHGPAAQEEPASIKNPPSRAYHRASATLLKTVRRFGDFVVEVVVKPLLYDNFDVLIERSGDAFQAKVVNSPAGETRSVPFIPPVSEDKLELLVLRLRTAQGVRGIETDLAPDAKQVGGTLFEALFHDEMLDRLRRSLSRTEASGRGLRIRLRFSDAHELWNMPWELLYDREGHRFLCQFDSTPVVRYVDMAQPVQPLVVPGPIRMLVMISSPSDYPPLDVDKEWQQLSEALQPLEATGSLQVERLPTASLEDLRRAMMFGDFHVFHYIGHGGLDRQSGEGLLVLTGPNGRSLLASGSELYVMLANSPIRLAVLNSCQGARISAADPYAGTAASLVHQGVPAVVAMQFEITDTAAIAFSRTMYEALAYGWPVDMAVSEARRAILAVSRSEWATPVLYLRASDGVLVDIPTPSRQPAPAQPTGLVGSVVDGMVALHWAPIAAGLTAVARWEVRRDGVRVVETTEPQATDKPPGPGSYRYSVVAVGTDGQHSAESAPWTAEVTSAPATLTGTPEAGVPVARGFRRWFLAAAGALLAAGAAGWLLLGIVDRSAAPDGETEAAELPVCSQVDASWKPINITPGGSATQENGSMIVTLTNAWYKQQGDEWLVRLETEARNEGTSEHYHGEWFYESLVVDTLPQGDVACFSITDGELVVEAGLRDIAQVGFTLDSDPTGKSMLLALSDRRSIQISQSV